MVVRSFKKVGIAVAVDGSEDNEIHIKGLLGYRVEDSNDEDDDYNDDDDTISTSNEEDNPLAGCNDNDSKN